MQCSIAALQAAYGALCARLHRKRIRAMRVGGPSLRRLKRCSYSFSIALTIPSGYAGEGKMSTFFRGNLTTGRCRQKKNAGQKSALAELGRAAGGSGRTSCATHCAKRNGDPVSNSNRQAEPGDFKVLPKAKRLAAPTRRPACGGAKARKKYGPKAARTVKKNAAHLGGVLEKVRGKINAC